MYVKVDPPQDISRYSVMIVLEGGYAYVPMYLANGMPIARLLNHHAICLSLCRSREISHKPLLRSQSYSYETVYKSDFLTVAFNSYFDNRDSTTSSNQDSA